MRKYQTLKAAAVVAVAFAMAGHQVLAESHSDVPTMPAPTHYKHIGRPMEVTDHVLGANMEKYGHIFKAPKSYHVGAWKMKGAYTPQRFVINEKLPMEFVTNDNHVLDFWIFGLETPPQGYKWVRYGPDAILVKVDNGRILQVVYELFA